MWLRSEIGVPFVLVGGSAIRIALPVGTKDVAVLVSAADLEKADSLIEGRRDAYPLQPATGTIRGTEVSIGESRVQVDFLSAGPFGGDEFLSFVRSRGSLRYEDILRARPAVVFYMRLALDDWRENIPSIERISASGSPVQPSPGRCQLPADSVGVTKLRSGSRLFKSFSGAWTVPANRESAPTAG